MANPAPTINQINAFNATQGTTIDFNIIGGTELVRSNRIYIYDLSDNSLICTHLYVSTESIHELPPNTDGSIVYESGKSSADFVNGAQYYAQIQTFTDIAGTEGGSGLSVAKMFWCLVDPTLTIDAIPSTISTTSYNVSATYNANTSVVSNIIQQYQFSLYSATGSLLQSSGVVVGSGEQQGTSTAYDISYNFTGLSVGSSYYVTVEVTTTQGMNVNTQSNTFTISIDTPTLGEATVVNNACDGYISVTSNLSSEYGGSGSGEIVSFETDSENVFTKLQVDLDPIQDLHGYDAPWVGGAGKNKLDSSNLYKSGANRVDIGTQTFDYHTYLKAGTYTFSNNGVGVVYCQLQGSSSTIEIHNQTVQSGTFTITQDGLYAFWIYYWNGISVSDITNVQLELGSTATSYAPYENICPISGWGSVETSVIGKNLLDIDTITQTNFAGSPSLTNVSINNYIYCKGFGTITWTSKATDGRYIRYYDFNKNQITQESFYKGLFPNATITTTVPNEAYYMRIMWYEALNVSVSDIVATNPQIELGSTPTAFEPYNGTTYHQEIEATYTPTVQENEAYLFKQTEDVGGDRETIELVGGTVAWNQWCTNGNFEYRSGNYGWYSSAGTVVVSDNIGKFTANAQNANMAISTAITNGHKYFVKASIKASSTSVLLAFWTSSKAVSSTGSFVDVALIANVNHDGTAISYPRIVDSRSSDFDEIQVKNVIVIDLTQMFGSTIADYIYSIERANAGAGVAWFKKLFPKPYYAYNAGELISVEGLESHNTVGFNQWDEEWVLGAHYTASGAYNPNYTDRICSKNYIPVCPSTTYYMRNGQNITNGVSIVCYDEDKNLLGWFYNKGNATFTTQSNCHYICFDMPTTYGTTYKNDICINLSWDGERNGEYEEYVKHEYPLDSDLVLRGIPKLDAGNNLYYDGDTYESDGTVTRKYGIVDLSAQTWNYQSAWESWYTDYIADMRGTDTGAETPKFICDKYDTIATNYGLTPQDFKGITSTTKGAIGCRILVRNGSTTVAPTGHLVYELATPTTETADPFESIQKVTPNYGTEEFVSSTIVPVGNNTQYLTRDIYGGTLDLVSGVLTVDRAMVDMGSLNWYVNGAITGGVQYAVTISDKKVGETNFICSAYETHTPSTVLGYICGRASTSVVACNATQTNVDDFKTAVTGQTIVYELATPTTYQLTPQQIQTLVGKNNVWSEQGEISLAYHIPITNLLVKRQDVDDVSGSWLTLYSQPITQASDMDFTFIDFTNQYGKTYKYALVPLLTQTQSGIEVEVEGGYTVSDEVQSIFDGVFIADQTGSQKCKANVGYGNVDMNQTVGTITPIGAKYPVVITNSKNQYHNGSISGTIVPDDYYFNGNLSRIDMVNKRDELEQFLTNKRAKIIKDWNGKIWLVMIMDNVSCTFNNNYGMGIVNFSTNWVEVGDPTNQQDLQATGLIDVGGA